MTNENRKQFFYWLGVLVLPFFWSWFTLARGRTRWARVIAFGWMLLLGSWLFVHREPFGEQLALIQITLPMVIIWITIGLWVWLAVRIMPKPATFIEWIVPLVMLEELLGAINAPNGFSKMIGHPMPWVLWILPLLPAALHLLVEPVANWLRRISR